MKLKCGMSNMLSKSNINHFIYSISPRRNLTFHLLRVIVLHILRKDGTAFVLTERILLLDFIHRLVSQKLRN